MASRSLYLALKSTLISGVAIGVINFLVQIYLARTMGVSIIADYAKIVVVAQIVLLFTSFSFSHGLIGVGYSVVGFRNLLSLSVVQTIIIIVAWIIVGLGLAWTYPQDAAQLAWPSIFYMIGTIAVNLGHTFNVVLEVRLNYTKLTRIRFASFAISGIIAILSSLLSKSVFSMVAKDLAFGLAFLAISLLFSTEQIAFRWDSKIVKDIVLFSRGLWFIRGTSEGAKRVTFSLLLVYLDKHQFGLYFQMRSIVDGVLTFFLYPIQSVLFSYFRSHRDVFDLRRIALYLLVASFCASIAGMLFFDVWGAHFVGFLLGSEWVQASEILAPLAIYASIVLCFEVLVSMAQANNVMRPIVLARLSWIAAIVAFVPPLAARYQLVGGAWATSLSTVVMLLVGLAVLLPRLRPNEVRA